MVGGIALLQEEDYLGAAQILAARPSLHTALFAESDVEGEFRTRRFTVLAGRPTTATTHIEYGIRFRIDLSKAYFSPRLATERQRLLKTVISGECVLDMFAGVGPFALTLARQASRVVAADLNPAAVRLMRENILLNRTANVLPVLADAACLPYILPGRFDRIVMNLPLNPVPFLPIAFNLCRPGGLIHCYVLVQEEGEILEAIHRHPVQHVRERYIRSYSAGRWHAVYDITVGREDRSGQSHGCELGPIGYDPARAICPDPSEDRPDTHADLCLLRGADDLACELWTLVESDDSQDIGGHLLESLARAPDNREGDDLTGPTEVVRPNLPGTAAVRAEGPRGEEVPSAGPAPCPNEVVSLRDLAPEAGD
jgi:tRNA (guanine37-N1)-methyltransferase